MAAAHTCTAASRNRINLINKYNTRRVLLCVQEQISHTGCAHADKHLYKIRTGNTEKGNICLPGYRFREQGLTGSGRALQQDALRDSCAHLGKFVRLTQKVDDLLKLILLLFQSRNIL